jgi:hypothetical protein
MMPLDSSPPFLLLLCSEIRPNEYITYDEFERRAKEGYEGLEFRRLNENDLVVAAADAEVEWY